MADLPIRTVRYYISIGLVDKPLGETRAARYTPTHLEQLLLIKRWTAQGLSLDRIRELLSGEFEDTTPLRPRRPGAIEVCSHLLIADGLELVIEPSRAQMSPEQLRRFARLVMQAHQQVMQPKPLPGI
jgi:DNA-binding transcriptional MerR regulator